MVFELSVLKIVMAAILKLYKIKLFVFVIPVKNYQINLYIKFDSVCYLLAKLQCLKKYI